MKKFTIICFFLSLEVVVIFGKETLCSSNKICECSQTKHRKVVNCRRVDNMKDIQDFFSKNLNFTRVSILNIKKCKTTSLPDWVFWNTTIRKIRFECPFHEMKNDALSPIKALKHLDLFKTKFLKIPIAISKLTNLKYLRITNSKLTRIDTELQNMTGLLELKMSFNPIYEVLREAFTGLSNLRMIDLSENKLIFLHQGTFDLCQNLTKIFLQKNSMNSVDGLFNISNLECKMRFDVASNPILLTVRIRNPRSSYEEVDRAVPLNVEHSKDTLWG
ncbi:hypothetical protein AVEN_271529-1 [Araneus ventricosus]|uniref:Uncharacterized protein n=1 Tax=Araneus ventricosus TaxID=182803 RepID=A0A4Y2G3Y3_ARAVE|nr:hypothetical protein AVEN_271529-1 [Araneus ventricosus]